MTHKKEGMTPLADVLSFVCLMCARLMLFVHIYLIASRHKRSELQAASHMNLLAKLISPLPPPLPPFPPFKYIFSANSPAFCTADSLFAEGS